MKGSYVMRRAVQFCVAMLVSVCLLTAPCLGVFAMPEPLPAPQTQEQTEVSALPTENALRLVEKIAETVAAPAYTTASDGVITTPGGKVYRYYSTLQVTATAYSCPNNIGTTAQGTQARYGAIAVDPAVIPYWTRMYVISNDGCYDYGVCTAEDCGSGVDGAAVDLYFNSFDDCWEFGRRDCTVYFLYDDPEPPVPALMQGSGEIRKGIKQPKQEQELLEMIPQV